MTSAPLSASIIAVSGPAMYWPKSITRIPLSTPLIRGPLVIRLTRACLNVVQSGARDNRAAHASRRGRGFGRTAGRVGMLRRHNRPAHGRRCVAQVVKVQHRHLSVEPSQRPVGQVVVAVEPALNAGAPARQSAAGVVLEAGLAAVEGGRNVVPGKLHQGGALLRG